MKVMIEGSFEQIEATLLPEQVNRRVRKNESRNAIRQQEITQMRKLLRKAFDRVRYDAERATEAKTLLNALAGFYTEGAVKLARQIVAEHS